jgi:hypothetical protein
METGKPNTGETTDTGNSIPDSIRGDEANADKVQCPNCCRLAPVTSRSMGLLFYKCDLCEAVGATPDPSQTAG